MKLRKIFIAVLTLCMTAHSVLAQEAPNESIIKYIETYAELAVKEMGRTGVPASIKIAQGIHETNAGKSNLVLSSNNHFGIKCKSSWMGDKVFHDDDAEGECFRKYKNAEASYLDHSDYLKSQPRYAFLFEYDADDYSSWAWGLKKAGYATNPIYAQTLIKYIEGYQLNELNQYAENEAKLDLPKFLEKIRGGLLHPSPGGVKPMDVTETANPADKKIDRKTSRKQRFKKTYIVKSGDSLYSLSKKYHTTVDALKRANHLKNVALQVGQKIKIPKK